MTPLDIYPNETLFLIRAILGVILIYHGLPKIKNLKANAEKFSAMGWKPGIVWGTIAAVIEFFGGIAIIFGIYTGIVATFIAIEMIITTIWNLRHKEKTLKDYSIDLALLAIALIILTFGQGSYTILPF